MITINNLYTGYEKSKPLLTDFNYVFENKIYGILGESGCGKTTLLRTIAGLIKPLSGEIIIDGNKVKNASNNNVYMMHQNYTSFDWLTCIENVVIARKINQKVTNKDYQNAREFIKHVGLEGYEDKYPKQLSGGQRQRLALARTLFANPQTILMDEPLSALDETTRHEMQDLIVALHRGSKNTIIMVTHSKNEAKKMCDVIINL